MRLGHRHQIVHAIFQMLNTCPLLVPAMQRGYIATGFVALGITGILEFCGHPRV